MEAYPDDGLGASIDPQMTFDRALDAVALGSGFYDALGVGDSPPPLIIALLVYMN